LKGKKKIRYLWKENRACVGGVVKPDDVTLECYAPHCDSCHMSTICNYFKAVLMFLLGAVLLAAVVIVLCYRNRRLKYKHSRFIDSSQMHDWELPQSEKCVMEED